MNYHNVVFETSYGKASQLGASDLVEIAFAGRSNVGKSSLINKIFNRKSLARVSAVRARRRPSTFSGWKMSASPTCRATAMPRSPSRKNSAGRT